MTKLHQDMSDAINALTHWQLAARTLLTVVISSAHSLRMLDQKHGASNSQGGAGATALWC